MIYCQSLLLYNMHKTNINSINIVRPASSFNFYKTE